MGFSDDCAGYSERYASDSDRDNMTNIDPRVWLRETCPTMFALLNSKAQKQLPCGLQNYLGSGSPRMIKVGRQKTAKFERALNILVRECGETMVAHAYGKVLSKIDIGGLRGLFDEIYLCSFLADKFDNPLLHPKTGKGTSSDCKIIDDNVDIWCEIKRFEDEWPIAAKSNKESNSLIFEKRSLALAPPDDIPANSKRPRFMDLRSKLADLPRQFPDNTINVLFIFHPGFVYPERYIEDALIGDSNNIKNSNNRTKYEIGLFERQEWQIVSACCYSSVCFGKNGIDFPGIWLNPNATRNLPDQFIKKLRA